MADTIEVKSSRFPSSPSSTTLLDAEYAKQVNTALLTYGGSKRVEEAMETELRKTGWLHDVREYVRMLFRTGECKSAEEAMGKVQRAIQVESVTGKEVNGAGESAEGGLVHRDPDPAVRKMLDDMAAKIRLPENVVQAGVGAVQKEVEKCVDITVDDYGS